MPIARHIMLGAQCMLNARYSMLDARCLVLGARQHWSTRSNALRARQRCAAASLRVVCRAAQRCVPSDAAWIVEAVQPAWKIPKLDGFKDGMLRTGELYRRIAAMVSQVSAVESGELWGVDEVVGRQSEGPYACTYSKLHIRRLETGGLDRSRERD
ncbi:hypothetical protein LZ32DRAFT_100698 [Colletotrichum eremochloae]|nr:hypothetical protein LZ32DRAFT_100698 [Colletotrichum eremochloae]